MFVPPALFQLLRISVAQLFHFYRVGRGGFVSCVIAAEFALGLEPNSSRVC